MGIVLEASVNEPGLAQPAVVRMPPCTSRDILGYADNGALGSEAISCSG
jgi:hypothetical protein